MKQHVALKHLSKYHVRNTVKHVQDQALPQELAAKRAPSAMGKVKSAFSKGFLRLSGHVLNAEERGK